MSERKVSKLQTLTLNALTEEYNSLVTALGATGLLLHYEEAATADIIATIDAVDLATGLVVGNELRALYVAHIASTKKHLAADATNTVTAPAATDQTELNTLLNELKVDLNAHQILLASHRGNGGQGSVSAAPIAIATTDASDLATSLTLVNALKAAWNHHVQSGAQNIDRDGT